MKVLPQTNSIVCTVTLSGLKSANNSILHERLKSFERSARAFLSALGVSRGVAVSASIIDSGFSRHFVTVTQGALSFRKRGKEDYEFRRRCTVVRISISYDGSSISVSSAAALRGELGSLFADGCLGSVSSVKLLLTRREPVSQIR